MQQDEETEGKGNEENGKEGENGAEGENHLEKLICCRDGSIIIYVAANVQSQLMYTLAS